jgi:Mg-chelatase subunit ChlD
MEGLGIGTYASASGIQLIPAANAATRTCVDETSTPEPLGLDLYVMVDTSGSMIGSRWTAVKNALTDFIDSPQSIGIGFGIQHYPLGADNCDPLNYSTAAVDIAPLQGPGTTQVNAIITAINTWVMAGGTPTAAALQGAIDRALQQKLAEPDHEVAVVHALQSRTRSLP